jgi:AP2 domain
MKLSLTNSPLPVHVDSADYPMLIAYSWALVVKRNKHYCIAKVKGRRVYMHRLIMGEPSHRLVDHKNGEVILDTGGKVVGLNNLRANLRICTRSQNMGNQKAHVDRLGKYKGVCQEIVDGKPGRYIAQICIEGKTRKLGRFDTAAGAAMVYDEAALKLFGAFARTNFQNEHQNN